MRCPICKGELKRGTTTFTADLEKGVLIIKNVPADVCNQCGEAFIPNDVAKSIEQVVKSAREKKMEIEIVSYENVIDEHRTIR